MLWPIDLLALCLREVMADWEHGVEDFRCPCQIWMVGLGSCVFWMAQLEVLFSALVIYLWCHSFLFIYLFRLFLQLRDIHAILRNSWCSDRWPNKLSMVIEHGPWLKGSVLLSCSAVVFCSCSEHIYLIWPRLYSRKPRTLRTVAFWASNPALLNAIFDQGWLRDPGELVTDGWIKLVVNPGRFSWRSTLII